MRKIMILARREYQALVRTKAFIISLVLMPILMFGAIFVQTFLVGKIESGEKTIIVLDGTGRMLVPLQALAQLRSQPEDEVHEPGRKSRRSIKLEAGPAGPVTDDMRLELSEKIRREEIFAFVEIDADALKPSPDSPLLQLLRNMGAIKPPHDKSPDTQDAPPEKSEHQGTPVRLYMQSITYNEIGQWVMQSINQAAFALRLEDAGLNPTAVAAAACPIGFAELGPYSKTSGGEVRKGDGATRGVTFFVPFGLMMLMFMSIMVVGQPMLTSVIEEKQQRIAEVLLGSASPFQLMMGKLIGNVAVALTMVGLYLVGLYFVAAHYGYADMVPVGLLGWFVVFEILACLLFGSVFIAVGAACTELKEAQSLMTPVMILVIMPLMVWMSVLQEPLSSFAKWISLFPPATPLLMMLRLAASPMVPLWQPVLGIALTLATTLACAFAASRVFRIGLLVQGKAPKIGELLGWIIRG